MSRLGAYFGEPLKSGCCHCSRRLDETTTLAEVTRPQPEMAEALWDQARQLYGRHAEILNFPSRLARFLCGISSPKLTRAKLTKDALFEVFEKVSYRQVLERADQLLTGE